MGRRGRALRRAGAWAEPAGPAAVPLRARCLWLMVLLALTSGAFRSAWGQGFEGKPIKRIEVITTPRLDPVRVREVMRTREGDLYRDQAIEEDIEALWRVGSLVDVSIVPSAYEDGVKLTVRASERATITRIDFRGELRLDEDELRDRLQMKVKGYHNPYQLKLDVRSLQDYYKEEGHVYAEIKQTVEPNPKGVDVIYDIDAGPRQRIESVIFQGNTAFGGDELEKQMTGTQPRGFLETGKFDMDVFLSDLDAVRQYYHGKGWLEATAGCRLTRDDTMQRLFVTVFVREGPRYRIEHIVIAGNSLFAAREILGVMKQKEGGWYEPEQLEKDKKAIRDLYGEQGYIYAEVALQSVFAAKGHSVALRLEIKEGEKFWLRDVRILGNRRTHDRVIRRELSFEPGERINTREVDESIARLKNTGLFSSKEAAVPTDPVRVRYRRTDDPDLADAVVEVEEGRLGNIGFGVGVSSSSGFFGKFTITHDNFDWADTPKSWRDVWSGDAFAGGGQSLTLSLTPGQYESDYRLRWFNPSLNDSPYSGGFDLYIRDNIYDKYTDTRSGITLSGGRRFFKRLNVTLEGIWEDIYIHEIDEDDENDTLDVAKDILDAAGHHEKRALAVKASYERRDYYAWPTKGYRLDFNVESAGSILGGGVDTLTETLEGNKYWTLWNQPKRGKHVLHLRSKIGFLQPTNSDGYVPIFQRFFAGGLGSIRGFDYRGVGPVDPVYEQQVGGKVLMIGNIEYFYPILENYLHGVVFVDVGKVDRHTLDFNLERMRVATGVGLRLRLPMLGMEKVPIVFDLGFPMIMEDTDETNVFTFSMGTGFAF